MLKKCLFIFLLIVGISYANTNVKDDLYKDIKSEFKIDFNAWESYFYKDTLMIRFSKNDILFKSGQSNMHRSFEIILKDFSPRFVEILTNPKYKDQIAAVTIKGHTSSENKSVKTMEEKFEKNLQLSQKRADIVLEYIKNLSDKEIKDNISWIDTIFAAEGVSSLEPIFNPNGKENKEASRRTEILITLKDPGLKDDFVENDEEKEEKPTKAKVEKKQAKPIKQVQVEDSTEDIVEEPKKKVFTLEQYVSRMLAQNPTLGEQHYLVQAFKKDIESAKGNFRPTVTLNYKYKYFNDYKKDNSSKQESERTRDVTVRYNIFNAYKDQKEEAIAKHFFQGSIYTKEQIENDLIYSVSEAYVALQKANEVYELSRKNYEDYIAWEEKTEIKFQNGLLSLKDFSKIQARSISRYMNFEEDTKRYIDGITTMQKYLDFNDNEIEYFEEPQPYSEYFDNINLSIGDSRLLSPYVKEAEENIKLYKKKMQQANVNFLPTLDLVAKKSVLEDSFKNPSSDTTTQETSLSFEAKLELYSGGKDQADYEKKLMEYRQKLQKRDAVIRDVEYKVDLALNRLNLLSIKEGFFKDLVNKREEEHIAANYDFKFGKIGENDLLDIVDSLYNAKRQFIENKYDLIAAKYKLLQEIGVIKANILEGE